MRNVLEVRNLILTYDQQIAAQNISFQLSQGDYLCIVGQNGSGKSSLMKAILGLLQPQSGSIQFEGIKPTEIGYLPQQTTIQKDFPATVYEIVLSGNMNKLGKFPFFNKAIKQKTMDMLDLLQISNLKDKSYRDLSGGQQQRVLLARALSATQKILLLDEPVTGLDPLVTTEFYRLIKNLNETQNLTVIMISHDITSAITYGSHILHLNTKQEFFGSAEEYMTTPLCKQFTGGVVYV